MNQYGFRVMVFVRNIAGAVHPKIEITIEFCFLALLKQSHELKGNANWIRIDNWMYLIRTQNPSSLTLQYRAIPI